MFLAMPFQTLLAIFARDVWHEGATGLGILNAAAGIGGVAGSAYVAWRGNRDERLRAQMLSVICFGLLLAAFAFCPWFVPALALIFCANIFASLFGTLNNTAIQLLIPDAVRGRVSAFLMMSFSLPMLGTLPLSRAAESVGAPMAVGAAALLAVVAAILFYLLSPELRRLDERVREATAEV
jgi:MFS family permease